MHCLRIGRAHFLHLGTLGIGAGLLVGPPGSAAAAAPAPQGDDLGFVQFGAVAELVSLRFLRSARQAAAVSGKVQQRIAFARDAKLRQFWMLNGILGTDGIQEGDFEIKLPRQDFTSLDRVAALGERIESLLVGTYLSGVHNTEDRATRLLLGRLLAYDAQQLAWMRELRGAANPSSLPSPLTLEQAGPLLDSFLETPR
ncbi:MAG: hypothetical protein QOE60_1102 [Thermoleophilaceae bacterium]|jgi:hypothetical protein|nr:hypothetical protein [Thermoleophilaceae bacterium]